MSQEIIYEGSGNKPNTEGGHRKSGSGVTKILGLGVAIVALVGIVIVVMPTLGQTGIEKPATTTVSSEPILSKLTAKVSGSETIIISEYSSGGYQVGLQCLIDDLSVYCDGSPITIQGLPPGIYTFTVIEKGKTAGLQFVVS